MSDKISICTHTQFSKNSEQDPSWSQNFEKISQQIRLFTVKALMKIAFAIFELFSTFLIFFASLLKKL